MTIMKERLASFEYNGEPVALIPARMQPIALNEYEQTMPDGLRVRLTVDGYEGGASRVLDELKRTQPYWTGDFYPLTAPSNDEDCWAAWQLGSEDGGVICAFRRDHCPQETFELRAQAIEADADYDVILSDEQMNAERKTLSGRALKSLVVRADRPRSSLLIEYKKHGTQHILRRKSHADEN